MRRLLTRVAIACLPFLAAGCSQGELRPLPGATAQPIERRVESLANLTPGQWRVVRVGGDESSALFATAASTKAGEPATIYTARGVELAWPLPRGYPEPTPPAAVEIKRHEAYRQAVYRTRGGANDAFMPLLRHIVRRDIAMTSPVVMTGEMAGVPDAEESTMAFLYAEPGLGPVGEAEERITVEDTSAMTVLAKGFIGQPNPATLNREVQELQKLVKAQKSWRVDGEPRLLVYNGPERRPRARWTEIQLPLVHDPPADDTQAPDPGAPQPRADQP